MPGDRPTDYTPEIAEAICLRLAEGVRAGYPDLNLLTPRHGFSGLVIELKREKNSSMTPEQADWLQWFNDQGFMAVCCKGFQAAKDTIQGYLGDRA